jgi:hypothetical protein
VPDLAERQRLLPVGELRYAGQVGPRSQDERLAGDADRDDLVPRQRGIKRGVQRPQTLGPEGVRLGVVVPVVERDERHRAGLAGQYDVPRVRQRDNLVGRQRGRLVDQFLQAHF